MLSLTLAGYFFFALVISFCCSLFEATLLSVTPTQIESMRKSGKRSGEILWNLRDRIDLHRGGSVVRDQGQTAAGTGIERSCWRKVRTAQGSAGANGSPPRGEDQSNRDESPRFAPGRVKRAISARSNTK